MEQGGGRCPGQHLEEGEHLNLGEGADPEKLSKAKCRLLHLGQDRMDGRMESSPSEKDLGDKLDVTWPGALPAWKASCVLGSSPAAGEGEILPSHKTQHWSIASSSGVSSPAQDTQDRAGPEESMEVEPLCSEGWS